jgi:XTP/dITP diphosphohydrolase
MSSGPSLVLGTYNRKKGEELAHLFRSLDVLVQTLDVYPQAISVTEDGDSFAANARLKATRQAVHLQRWVLGEDSGLSVAALHGEPGVYSARFAGEAATDQTNNQLLLEKLGDTPLDQRTAFYTCHMTLADPQGEVRAESESYCHGRMRFEPAGTNGFGYDPLFELHEYHQTFGQLGSAVKSALSHRARAAHALLGQLRALIREGQWT